MSLLSQIFKSNTSKIKALIKKDAIILDVRTLKEWNEAHISNAIHVPLKELNAHIDALKKTNRPVIAHCKSGVRSAKATQVLKLHNIESVNGGGLLDLMKLIDQTV
jgi:rhodanese-related sulfurtransferase